MGRLFQGLFEGDGYRVLIAGRRTELTYEQLATEVDVVIVTVPIERTAEIVARIAPVLRPEQLLSDFTSIKAEPVRAMLATPACVIGCHPVFGPVPDVAGQNVVLCPARPGPYLEWYRDWFRSHGMHVEIMEPEAHDAAMGFVQGLTHFVNIAFAHTLDAGGVSVDDLMKVSSPVYRTLFSLMGRILGGDAGLYAAIQIQNPHSRKAVKALLQNGAELLAAVEREDGEALQRLMGEAAAHLGEAGKTAREASGRLLERLEPAGAAPNRAKPGQPVKC